MKIYNSLTNKKEDFKPKVAGEVGLYICGQTVYDYCHIGHARTMVAFDVIVRHLRAINYKVTYVRNITDIDDKIINRANENSEEFSNLTERMIKIMHEDEASLNLLSVDHEPRATQNISQIIDLITILQDKGFAYQAANGDVLYNVEKFDGYGKLSNKDLEGQVSGARVDVDLNKKHPFDFVLWKPAKENEPSWDSPWGKGRPGWHIECSAMAKNCLGDTFDIHGGGFDLQFPHHENEIAQSEAANGKCFANYWMHSGFLNINNEKMSKSLNNFFTIRDVLKSYNSEVVRYFLITSHYRSQLNYSTDNLDAAKTALTRLYQSISDLETDNNFIPQSDNKYVNQYDEVMADDFNTPEAVAILFKLSHEINRKKQAKQDCMVEANTLMFLAKRLGLLYQNVVEFFKGSAENSHEIDELVKQRNQARADKNWSLADEIRDKLAADGIEILDGAKGTTWRKV